MESLASCSSREEALGFLLGRIDYERTVSIPYQDREFRLGRMIDLMARLGNPQDRLRIVHVAGTKGKGSTSAMIAAMLAAAGYRTGLYTSPHLDRLEERWQIDGRPCSVSEFVELVDHVRPVVEELDHLYRRRDPPESGPTYFEITTAIAFLHFARAQVDAAVVEVGLGGRLDSTNVCQPLVSVITSISFDHTKQLGHTLSDIAAEKAGIIKPGVPVVSGVLDEEPQRVISSKAQLRGCRLLQLGTDFDFQYLPPQEVDQAADCARGLIEFQGLVGRSRQRLAGVELGLLGRHQAANAAVAIAALMELSSQGWQVSETAIRRGLSELRWPARIEMVARRPAVVVDAAHNVASVQSLLETLDESFRTPRRLLVFATTQEKDVRGMLQWLLPRFEAVILTRYLNNPRAVGVEELDALAAEISSIPRIVCPDPKAAWRQVQTLAAPEHLVCVTGSFFLAAEMRREIASTRRTEFATGEIDLRNEATVGSNV